MSMAVKPCSEEQVLAQTYTVKPCSEDQVLAQTYTCADTGTAQLPCWTYVCPGRDSQRNRGWGAVTKYLEEQLQFQTFKGNN